MSSTQNKNPVKSSPRKKTKKPGKDVYLEAGEKEENDPEAVRRGDVPMTVVGHLDELRNRIIICMAALGILIVAAFFLSDYLLGFINDPFIKTGKRLNIFVITGGVFLRMKIALISGIFLSIPIIFYQIWKYIKPAVSLEERSFSRITLLSSMFFFYSGSLFVFFILLPLAIRVLLGFISDDMNTMIGADDYIGFIVTTSLAAGLLFELPILAMILTRMGILTPSFLIEKRKYSIIIIWITAAIITPQDILSQVLVALPLMLIYEISIIVSRLVMFHRKKRIRAAEN